MISDAPVLKSKQNRQRPLTPRSRALYLAICQYKREHDGNSPSTKDLMSACGISSTGVVNWNLRRLQSAGLIELEHAARSIRVVGGAWTLDA